MKVMMLALFAVASLSIAGCGEDKAHPTPEKPMQPAPSSTPSNVAPPQGTATADPTKSGW
jgi:hypothetical protein